MYQKGLRLAEQISRESRAQGRRRRPEPGAEQEGTEAGGKEEKTTTARTTATARTTTTACTSSLLAFSTESPLPAATARPPDALRPPSDRRALRTVGGGVFKEASLQSVPYSHVRVQIPLDRESGYKLRSEGGLP